MKKLLFVLGVGLLAACGGDDGDGAGGGSGNPNQAIIDMIPNADSANGGSIYSSLCGTSSCHGPNGDDGSATAGDLPAVVPSRSDAALVSAVVDGIGSMPPQSQLDDESVADVILYIKENF